MKTSKTPKVLLQHLMMMDDLEYGRIVMRSAHQYLHQVLLCDKQGKEMLYRHRNFWIWWRKQWERRNRILIAELHLDDLDSVRVDLELSEWVRREFLEKHSIKRLQILPNRLVLASSFASAMNMGLFKPENEKAYV